MIAEHRSTLSTSPRSTRLTSARRLAKGNLAGVACLGIFLTLIVIALLGPAIAPHDAYAIQLGHRLEAPSSEFWFGTDASARDVFSRVLLATRWSLGISFASVTIGVLTGSVLGLLSAVFGSWIDMATQRIVDIWQAVPGLILVLVLVSLLGPSLPLTVFAVAFVVVPGSSRLVRASAMEVMSRSYVEAAVVSGCSASRIILRHVLPNAMPMIIVAFTLGLGNAILVEASLSFLGLGVPPPTPSLGGMLSTDGRTYFEQVPTLALFPGVVLSLIVLLTNILGDWLRDVLDPRVGAQ